MHTSTSNSSTRRPPSYWRRTWLLTIVLLGFIFFSWEFYNVAHSLWRTGTNDSESLWAEKRISASQLGEAGIVLIGASRIQLGVDIPELQHLTGQKVVQLAIDGNPYMAVLEDLAADEAFLSTVVVSTTVEGLLKDQNTKNRAHQYLKHYHSITNGLYRFETIEAVLVSMSHRYIYSLSNFVTPYKRIVWPKERLIQAGYLQFNSDRSVDANYSLVDIDKIYADRVKRHLGGEIDAVFRPVPKFEENIEYVNSLVSKIMDRGGRVIFVRFPTGKGVWEIDETRYPKKVYWEKFAELSLSRTVHFEDYESLSDFDLPDGSHLDRADKVEFTQKLSKIIF